MFTEYNRGFGQRLQHLCEKDKPAAIANRLGVSVVSLRNWCKGDLPHILEVLAKLKKIYDIDIDTLFKEGDSNESISNRPIH